MKTTYLGLELVQPVIVSSSPYTATLAGVEECAAHGAGAVVLKSVFQEQVERHAAVLEQYAPYPEAYDYLRSYLGSEYVQQHLELIRRSKERIPIPVIGSINCLGPGQWVNYAAGMQQAGADAIELNIFVLPTDPMRPAAEVEHAYMEVAAAVAQVLSIPFSVKLGMRFTNLLAVEAELLARGCRGVVLYNRYFEADIDIERLRLVPGDAYSHPSELRNALRWVALTAATLPQLDISVSTGVHTGSDAVKALLAGASAVQVCTAIHLQGMEAIRSIGNYVTAWAFDHNFDSVAEFRGRLDYARPVDNDLYQRVQYMRYFPGEEYPPR